MNSSRKSPYCCLFLLLRWHPYKAHATSRNDHCTEPYWGFTFCKNELEAAPYSVLVFSKSRDCREGKVKFSKEQPSPIRNIDELVGTKKLMDNVGWWSNLPSPERVSVGSSLLLSNEVPEGGEVTLGLTSLPVLTVEELWFCWHLLSWGTRPPPALANSMFFGTDLTWLRNFPVAAAAPDSSELFVETNLLSMRRLLNIYRS